MTPLEESIEHWERLVSGNRLPNENIGINDCALCRAYLYNSSVKACVGCPVSETTGKTHCENTPYNLVMKIKAEMFFIPYSVFLDTKEFKEAAKKELEFLKSLLPKTMNLRVKFGFIREFEIPDEIKDSPSEIGKFIANDFEQAENGNEIIRYYIEETTPSIPELLNYQI